MTRTYPRECGGYLNGVPAAAPSLSAWEATGGWTRSTMAGSLYSVRMSIRSLKEIPGIEFVVDARGRRKSVVIDLAQHRALWEDLFDAYTAQQRCSEPRESLSKVKKLVQSAPRRRTRGRLQA